MSSTKEGQNTNEDDDEDFYDCQKPEDHIELVQRGRSRSRSRINHASLPTTATVMRSRNPFLNFISLYRQSHRGIKSSTVFKICGKLWRSMTEVEKKPYVDAANAMKHSANRKRTHGNPDKNSKDDNNVGDKNNHSPDDHNNTKNKKHEVKHKENNQKRDSDSESAASGTMGSASDVSGTS